MTTVGKLFMHRVINEWKFQWSVWRTAIDWTVALYMVIPALIFMLKLYYDLWKVQPAWPSQLSFNFIALVPLLFALSGKTRVFVEEADQLFLFQRDNWIIRIKIFSFSYSAVVDLIATCLLFACLAPILLLSFKLTAVQIALWTLFCFLLKSVTGLNKQLVSLRFVGWRRRFALWLLLLLCGSYYQGSILLLQSRIGMFTIAGVILLLVLMLVAFNHIKSRNNFLQEVALEQVVKLRYASLFLRAAFVYTRKSTTLSLNNRPLVFYNSYPIFTERTPSNLLTEACLKSVLRNKSHLLSYGQLVILCVAIVSVLPLEWKWVSWFGFAVLLTKFVELFWRQTKNSPFVQMFPWKQEDQSKAAVLALFLLMLLGFVPVSFALGLGAYSWIGAVALLPAAGLLGYNTAKLVAAFS